MKTKTLILSYKEIRFRVKNGLVETPVFTVKSPGLSFMLGL